MAEVQDFDNQEITKLTQEIERLKWKNLKYEHLKKVYKCRRELNKLVLENQDRYSIVRKTCEYLTQFESYNDAWIALFDDDGHIEHLVSTNGFEQLSEVPKSDCCRFIAEAGQVRLIKKSGFNCGNCPLLSESEDLGVMSTSISSSGKSLGVLTVSLASDFIGEDDETEAFQEIAEDLGIVLSKLETIKSNRKFEYVINKMPNIFSFLSVDYRYLAVNERYTDLFNIPATNMIGRSVQEFFGGKDFESLIRPMLDKCLKGESVDYLLKFNFDSIGTRWMHMYYYPYIEDNGTITGVISHGIDVTDKKTIEDDLFKFRKISDEAQHGVAIADMDGCIVYINKYYSELCSYTHEELIGENYSCLYSEDTMTQIDEILSQLIKNGFIETVELVHLTKDGTQVPLLFSGLLIKDENGKPEYTMVTAQDLTKIKQAEHRLSISQDRFHKLVDTAPDVISIITVDGIIEEINSSACERLGYSRDEIVGKTINVLDPAYTQADFKEFWEKIPYDEQYTFESVNRTKDCGNYPVEISGRKILLGNETFIISIARDITERKNTQARLIAAVKKAEESDRLKSAFLANMSHEIRTPLNGILGFSSLMNEPGISPAKLEQYHSIINESGQRLLSTINDLIDISRIEAGIVELDRTVFDVNNLLNELYRFFKPEINSKGLNFIRNWETNNQLQIETDYAKIYAILLNILKNAVKFTEKGSISLTYSIIGREIEFVVTDTGVGIPQEKAETIFSRFVQVDSSLTKPYEGSGLGLAICREYIDLLNGKIRLESKPGEGSAFYITIPGLIKET